MTEKRVQEFYDMLKHFYLKPDSDWADKAKAMRTIAHDFYKEISRTDGTFADSLKEFYKWNRFNEVSKAAFALKDRLNDIVHKNLVIEKAEYITYYNMMVRLIYLATSVLPDEATMEYIGYKSTDELAGLTDEQKDSVLCDDQIIYVSAGPGTGKTFLLVNKLLHYINVSTSPEKIVALSYTNTAANELGVKFQKAAFEAGVEKPYEFYNGTLHAFCYKMIRTFYQSIGKEFNAIIIDDTDIADLAEEFRIQLGDIYNKEDIQKCLKSRLKTKDVRLQELVGELKARYNVISIDDLLLTFIDHLGQDGFHGWFKNQVTVLVIDEAQDLTELNYRIFDRLLDINPELKLFLVGDSRQNIFGFNGGSYEFLNNFLRRHDNYTKKNLTGTFRCPQPVCDYVNAFHFIDCENTPLRSVGENTGVVKVNDFASVESEAQFVVDSVLRINDLNNTAVLCQSLKYLETFIATLGKAGVPYRVFGGQKLVKPHIKLFNHLLRIIENDNEYSMKAIDRAFAMKVSTSYGKNLKERFYNTLDGQKIQGIKDEIDHRMRVKDDMPMEELATHLIDTFFANAEPKEADDFKALKDIMAKSSSIDDFLLTFALDRESFSRFIEKNYVECKVPIGDKCLTVSTIHSAKGLEWKNVFVMGLAEDIFPNMWFFRNESQAEQDKALNDLWKLMFVAATRTKGNLFLTYSCRDVRGFNKKRSRFLLSL